MEPQSTGRTPHEITIEEIEAACCEVFSVSPKEINDIKNICRHVSWARHAKWYLIRHLKNFSYGVIADIIDRPRNSVHYGIASMNQIICTNSFVREGIIEVGKKINCTEFVKGFVSSATKAA